MMLPRAYLIFLNLGNHKTMLGCSNTRLYQDAQTQERERQTQTHTHTQTDRQTQTQSESE